MEKALHSNTRISELLQALNHPSLPGIDLSLERIRALLNVLGEPQNKLPPVIHLAGTNGKGSTQAFLRAIYQAAGYRVHAYTSPHLVRFNERIVIGGAEVSDAYLLELLERVHTAAAHIPVTFFEATTAAAFLAFAEHSADVVLLETGMGGRLDATNVVEKPLATVITPIDYDHKEFLGDTLAAIAAEKAGIIKQGVLCVVGEQCAEVREVLKRVARLRSADLVLHGRNWSYERANDGFVLRASATNYVLPAPALVGSHQYHNAALAAVTALSLAAVLPVTQEALASGITKAVWPARLQRLRHGMFVDAWSGRGDVYLDGGHNPQAAHNLAQWMAQHKQPLTLILGMMARKDAQEFLRPLVPYINTCITVPVEGGECYAPNMLAKIALAEGIKDVYAAPSVAAAAEMLKNTGMGTLLLAGSLFLAGEVLKNHG